MQDQASGLGDAPRKELQPWISGQLCMATSLEPGHPALHVDGLFNALTARPAPSKDRSRSSRELSLGLLLHSGSRR